MIDSSEARAIYHCADVMHAESDLLSVTMPKLASTIKNKVFMLLFFTSVDIS